MTCAKFTLHKKSCIFSPHLHVCHHYIIAQTEIRNGLQIPAVVNLAALLDLLCVKDTSDSYCFYQLERPLLENDNDPVRSSRVCSLVM